MTEQTTEFRGNFTDVVAVHELRGSYPDIPLSENVDYSALIADDADPMFITLPIGKANATSENNRFYDEAWVSELERQVTQKRPIGLMGHLSETERPYAMPPEAVFWLGTKRDGDLLWAKGFVPNGPAKDRIKRYKASGKTIATSIDVFAEGKWNKERGAYHMDAATMRLNQIDIAPADRAGIPALAAVPHITTEIADETHTEVITPQEGIVDKLELIKEMTVEDARLLPETVREAIKAEVPTPAEVALVQEMRTAMGLPADADLLAAVKGMADEKAHREAEAVTARVKELVSDPDKGVKIESARAVVTELVMARKPTTTEEAEIAFGEVVESEAVTGLLKETVQRTMGPGVRPAAAAQTGKPKYFNIPEPAKAS